MNSPEMLKYLSDVPLWSSGPKVKMAFVQDSGTLEWKSQKFGLDKSMFYCLQPHGLVLAKDLVTGRDHWKVDSRDEASGMYHLSLISGNKVNSLVPIASIDTCQDAAIKHYVQNFIEPFLVETVEPGE